MCPGEMKNVRRIEIMFNKNNRKEESMQNAEQINDNYGLLLDKLAKSEPIFNDDQGDDQNR
jgi:hypothetical protein